MAKRIITKLISHKYLLCLIAIAILTHIEWFNFNSILSFSDWYYWPNSAVDELYYSWGTWITQWQGVGFINIQIYFNSFYIVWSLLSKIGLDFDVSSKLNLFIPIAILGFISPYFLVRKIISDDLIAFACALFYGSTTYFLVLQTAHLPIAFVYSISPMILLLFMRALEINKHKDWIVLSFFYSIAALYEIRITYIVTLILGLYFLLFYIKKIKFYLKNILLFIFLVLALNLFWVLPTVFGGLTYEVGQVASRGLFGGFLTNINYAIAMYHWSWTGGYPDQNFNPQQIQVYFWLIPLFIFYSFIFYKKVIPNRLFFLILALLGIFLTKQSSPPLQNVYAFLYDYFPGFVLFRESSKFYLVIAIGYLGLLAYALNFLRNKTLLYYLAVISIIVLSLINLLPLFTKEIRGLTIPRSIPNDYSILNQKVSSETDYFRVLYIPTYSRWSDVSNLHPRLSLIGLIQESWNFTVKTDQSSLRYKDAELMVKALKSGMSNNLLDTTSIKYVVVPLLDKENEDDFFIFYGKDRKYYVDELSKIDYLHKLDIGTSEVAVFENYNYRPHIYITNDQDSINKNQPLIRLDYKFINPTRYTFSVKNVSAPFYINFSESYHPQWRVRVGSFSWFDVLTNSNYFISDVFHTKNDANLNSFLITPNEVCMEFVCQKNEDNTYDIEATIYFKPQSYFYPGVIISLFTLTFLIVYSFYLLIRFYLQKYVEK